jgi:hypothetical protein
MLNPDLIPPLVNETISVQTKIKYKTFVNIGNDCIFMKQRVPDFFMIPDKQMREATKNEYISDHGGNEEWLKDLFRDQIQKEGSLFIKNLLWLINTKIKGYSTIQKIYGFCASTGLEFEQCKKIMKEVKEEKKSEKEMKQAKAKITESTYRTFKETLCPV